MNWEPEPLLYEQSVAGRSRTPLGASEVPSYPLFTGLGEGPGDLPDLPDLTEAQVVRHYTRLSQFNFSIDGNFYPLGSCTMKHNPKITEEIAAQEAWTTLHPLVDDADAQGALALIHSLERDLSALGGFYEGSLQCAAGAQGEFAGLLMIRAWLRDHGQGQRELVLVPDSAHGTNPATATMAGCRSLSLPSDAEGLIDLAALRDILDRRGTEVVALMVTNPNTLGLFEDHIEEVADLVHRAGGLVYGDGANLNALVGRLAPGAHGIDVMHYNLHKTFATPHGGGGPGAAYVGAREDLAPYLPGPRVSLNSEGLFQRVLRPRSIGDLKLHHGNFGILVRAWAWIRMQGLVGLREVSAQAVLNARYLQRRLSATWPVPYPRPCMHEFVASGQGFGEVHTLDVAKRLIDHGIHPPTIYFPLIVPEALMIEPTESETLESLDHFVAVMEEIRQEAQDSPALLHEAPHHCPVGRLDEVRAARCPVLCYSEITVQAPEPTVI